MTDSADRTPASRGRGRPSVVDHDAVAEAAILLWTERGYEQTTWRDLAEATGVSERTLLRHFQTRAAIAWTGVDAARERLAASTAAVIAATCSATPMPARGEVTASSPGRVRGCVWCPAASTAGVTRSHAFAFSQNPGTRTISMPRRYSGRRTSAPGRAPREALMQPPSHRSSGLPWMP